MPTWTTPKTNWKGTDTFNASDWLRIIGNVEYIADAISYSGFTPFPGVIEDGKTVITADQRNQVTFYLNQMYKLLYASWERGFVFKRKNFGATWNSKDLNAIEEMLLNMKKQIDGDLPQSDLYRAGEEIICGDTISVGLL